MLFSTCWAPFRARSQDSLSGCSAAADSILATAASYAVSGLVDLPLAAVFVAGRVAGSTVGSMAARRLSNHKGRVEHGFCATRLRGGRLHAVAELAGAYGLTPWGESRERLCRDYVTRRRG